MFKSSEHDFKIIHQTLLGGLVTGKSYYEVVGAVALINQNPGHDKVYYIVIARVRVIDGSEKDVYSVTAFYGGNGKKLNPHFIAAERDIDRALAHGEKVEREKIKKGYSKTAVGSALFEFLGSESGCIYDKDNTELKYVETLLAGM